MDVFLMELKKCCLDIWQETYLAFRMASWEIIREEIGGDYYYHEDVYPFSYTCPVCGRQWNNQWRLKLKGLQNVKEEKI